MFSSPKTESLTNKGWEKKHQREIIFKPQKSKSHPPSTVKHRTKIYQLHCCVCRTEIIISFRYVSAWKMLCPFKFGICFLLFWEKINKFVIFIAAMLPTIDTNFKLSRKQRQNGTARSKKRIHQHLSHYSSGKTCPQKKIIYLWFSNLL